MMKSFTTFLREADESLSSVWMHGTSSICLPGIQTLGLMPQYTGAGAYRWAKAQGIQAIPKPHRGIYLTQQRATAVRYAYLTQADRGGNAIIVYVKMTGAERAQRDSEDDRGIVIGSKIAPGRIDHVETLPDNPQFAQEYSEMLLDQDYDPKSDYGQLVAMLKVRR